MTRRSEVKKGGEGCSCVGLNTASAEGPRSGRRRTNTMLSRTTNTHALSLAYHCKGRGDRQNMGISQTIAFRSSMLYP